MITNSGIYKIINTITGDFYIGSAVNISNRWKRHRYELRKNLRGNTHFQNAWNKYGEQAFEFSVILLCDIEHKLYFEDGLIKLLHPAYNISDDATAPMQGRHHTELARAKISVAHMGTHRSAETRAKISVANKGKPCSWLGKHLSAETRAKIGNANKSRVISAETRAKMSESAKTRLPISEESRAKISAANKGNTNFLGHKHTAETRVKISVAGKGRHPTAESRAKISAANKGKNLGKHHTEETRAKMRGRIASVETRAKLSEAKKGNANALGYKHTAETCAKVSVAHMGIRHTAETRAKMSEMAKNVWSLRRKAQALLECEPVLTEQLEAMAT